MVPSSELQLKQSPLLWYEEFAKYLRSVKYTPLWSDNGVFRHRGTGAIIVVYVDYLLIISQSKKTVDAFARLLQRQFKVRELGDMSFFLGCRIIRNRTLRKLWLVQDAYVEQVAQKHYLTVAAREETPIVSHHMLQKAPEGYGASKNLQGRYQSLVGSLMWPAMQTRPDIGFVVGLLARHLTNPTPQHWTAAFQVLQ